MTNCNEYGRLEGPESAIVEGYLCEVNPKLGTAEIHVYGSDSVPLRFVPSLERKMLRLETKFVKVRGQGWINDTDEWIAVNVDDVTCLADKPFDLNEFYNNPAPKIFNPDKAVRAREPFDVDQFLRDIYEARGRRES